MKTSIPIVFFLCFSLALSSCSVKEDRTDCPCYVSVMTDTDSDNQDPDHSSVCLVTFFDDEGRCLDSKLISSECLRSGDNRTKVRKGNVFVSVLQNKGEMILEGSSYVRCREGEDSEPIYSWLKCEVARGDELLVKGTFQKQFARVTLSLVNSGSSDYPYDLQITSGQNGLNLFSLQSSEGELRFCPTVEGLVSKFRLPRQKDGGWINLSLVDKETGAVSGSLDLGSYIDAAGYSWNSEYLGDINLVIDYSRCTLTINVNDWDEGKTFSFVI